MGGQTGDIHIPLGLNGSRNPTHSIVAFSNSNAGILDRRGWGVGGKRGRSLTSLPRCDYSVGISDGWEGGVRWVHKKELSEPA